MERRVVLVIFLGGVKAFRGETWRDDGPGNDLDCCNWTMYASATCFCSSLT